jgi:hypothetical protein
MSKPKNASAAISAILDSVEALLPIARARNDRGSRLRQAEREVAASNQSQRPVSGSARLAGAERDVGKDAKQARLSRAAREFRNRYDLWRV